MAYLRSETATLQSRADDLTNTVIPHIQPGTLYPAVRGLLINDSADFLDESLSGRSLSLSATSDNQGDPANEGIYHNVLSTQPSGVGLNSAITTDGGVTRLTTANMADFAFGTGDFTIELWFRRHDAGTCGIIQMYSDSTNRWQLSHFSHLAWYSNVGGSSVDCSASHGADTNWTHVAIVGDDSENTLTVYRNGTQDSQITSFTQNMSVSTGYIYFGTRTDNGSDFTTYSANLDINMIRIVKGTAVYTGNFTPPTALTATGGTYASTTNVETSITSGHTKVLINSDVGNVGAYGTEQADGKKYFYTDIKGSKNIEDPRIGAHFGSQRHMFKSLQYLEQETASYGEEVFSIDGRKWARAANFPNGSNYQRTTAQGNYISLNRAGSFLEITGYFNDFNILHASSQNDHRVDIWVNGVEAWDNLDFGALIANPKASRYVDRADLRNINITSGSDLSADTPLGINTIKILYPSGSADNDFYGCELIAQDVGSTARKSQINIPAQNVVSYGRKFSIGSDTLTDSVHTHYDPFNGFTNSSDLHSDYVDTATSLGLDTAPGLSAGWQITGSNHIRPFNGGRVVKWVDSEGTIKTSVNMVPPNAQNYPGTASNEITTPSATNTHTINFSDDKCGDLSLSETAKTFRPWEYGNGSANGNTTYRDASFPVNMDTSNGFDCAYVMDDGLTAMSASNYKFIGNQPSVSGQPSGNYMYLSFIGTGINYESMVYYSGQQQVAHNLPYGSHIFRIKGDGAATDLMIDGIKWADIQTGGYGTWTDVHFLQPRRPPIPEDAVVIADYMLMADFVAMTAMGTSGGEISKGVRLLSPSRDVVIEETVTSLSSAMMIDVEKNPPFGLQWAGGGSTTFGLSVPFFGTRIESQREVNGTSTTAGVMQINGSNVNYTAIDSSFHSRSDMIVQSADSVLGNNTGLILHINTGQVARKGFAIPTHTSNHYQAFETPYLHELVGGDRNMEQTNLVVTSDGKTWDEFTRDTSYLSNVVYVGTNLDANFTTTGKATHEFCTDLRGQMYASNTGHGIQKNFSQDFNHWTCLKDGEYQFYLWFRNSGTDISGSLVVNAITSTMNYKWHWSLWNTVTKSASHVFPAMRLQRGDKLMIYKDAGTIMGSAVESGPFIYVTKKP